jgi:hypothetical protein
MPRLRQRRIHKPKIILCQYCRAAFANHSGRTQHISTIHAIEVAQVQAAHPRVPAPVAVAADNNDDDGRVYFDDDGDWDMEYDAENFPAELEHSDNDTEGSLAEDLPGRQVECHPFLNGLPFFEIRLLAKY